MPTSPDYLERNDPQFRLRIYGWCLLMAAATGGNALLWYALELATHMFLTSAIVSILIVTVTMIISLRRAKCPSCGAHLKVGWDDPAFSRGEMLCYHCDHCRITWRTRIYQGEGSVI
jgi:hypothetical protein